MIKIECNAEYNNLRKKIIGGRVTSIWKESAYFTGAKSFPLVNFNYLTSEFSDFEKNVFDENQKMVYHLSGYGVNWNEATASYLGESSERYTFASFYSILENFIIKASYTEMAEKYGEKYVCELRLLNAYFSSEDPVHYVNENDLIQWVEMNSLIDLDSRVYIPLQFIVSNNGNIYKNEKPFMTSAVSTGTASHESVVKSLENAIIEYLQIDSFNLWWYGGIKGKDIEVDITSFLMKYFKNEVSVRNFMDYFDIYFTDISYDKGIDIIVCEIFSKNSSLPAYTVGVQGGKSLEEVLYRGMMECLAVVEYNMNLPWMDQKKYMSIKKNKTAINNLDDNVTLYAKYGKPKQVKHEFDLHNDCHKTKSYNAIEEVRKISKYAGYLVITLPDFEKLNLEVCRVSIPELLPLCLPSYPPYYHKRYEELGGIKNNVPHPLA